MTYGGSNFMASRVSPCRHVKRAAPIGEVVVSSSDDIEEEEEEEEQQKKKMKREEGEEGEEEEEGDGAVERVTKLDGEKQAGGSSSGVVKWERFLPRMVLRVLLVEADDSTRQIIAALLRKCSYRVAAVPDGLKAWELLKGRPHNVDLILTEVDLPSISGYALLTLIMEHDICKNIPVIMMSSQDAVSTVYKCMLRGAADYLVKPIRRNELKNLWQHVWRRRSQSTSSLNGRQHENIALQKAEATAENDSPSNQSSGYMGCLERDKELIEKGSDAQSSCTKPDLEVEAAEIEQVPNFSEPGWDKSSAKDMKVVAAEEKMKSRRGVSSLQEDAHDASAVGACKHSHALTQTKDATSEVHRRDQSAATDARVDNDGMITSYRRAINLIGAFENNSHANYVDCPVYSTRQSDFLPQLDLSLKRSDPSMFGNHNSEERHTLKHSDASAFSRYVNKSLHLLRPGPASIPIQQMEHGSFPDKDVLYVADGSNPDAPGSVNSTPKSTTVGVSSQSKQYFLPCPQQNGFPAPIPVRGLRFENLSTEYGSVFPRIYCAQSVPSPIPSSSTAGQQDPFFRAESFHQSSCENNNCDHIHNPVDQNTSNSSHQSRHKQELMFDSLEDRGHISPGTDRSGSSSFCNGTLTRLSSIECGSISGSNGNMTQASATKQAGESKGGDSFVPQDGSSQRSTQREAALAKFRLKRKDRCYEKKVRYESRKKLAEQRPRVKGQFVRQVPTDPAHGETNP